MLDLLRSLVVSDDCDISPSDAVACSGWKLAGMLTEDLVDPRLTKGSNSGPSYKSPCGLVGDTRLA